MCKLCYVCKKECRGNIGETYYSIGKDKINKEELYRHVKCKPGLPNMKIRKA